MDHQWSVPICHGGDSIRKLMLEIPALPGTDIEMLRFLSPCHYIRWHHKTYIGCVADYSGGHVRSHTLVSSFMNMIWLNLS